MFKAYYKLQNYEILKYMAKDKTKQRINRTYF